MNYVASAFHAVCKEAASRKEHYVVLWQEAPFYGGPEEGGWWGADQIVEAYEQFPTADAAEAAAEKVRTLAEELSAESKREFGEQCLREMEWLESRGLDADFLPEPDGESRYYVTIETAIPKDRIAERGYC